MSTRSSDANTSKNLVWDCQKSDKTTINFPRLAKSSSEHSAARQKCDLTSFWFMSPGEEVCLPLRTSSRQSHNLALKKIIFLKHKRVKNNLALKKIIFLKHKRVKNKAQRFLTLRCWVSESGFSIRLGVAPASWRVSQEFFYGIFFWNVQIMSAWVLGRARVNILQLISTYQTESLKDINSVLVWCMSFNCLNHTI